MILSIKDETLSAGVFNELFIDFDRNEITVKDLIIERVIHEVEAYNNSTEEYFKGLVKPTDAEVTINGYRRQGKKQIDPEQQIYIALNAFSQNGYFILINDLQAESLDQKIQITTETCVRFIKIVPLIGG